MPSLRLVILDSDQTFIEKLAAWIQKNMPNRFSLEFFTKADAFQSWQMNNGKADILLIASSFYAQSSLSVTNFVLLDDGTPVELPPSTTVVSKYRPVTDLVKDILACCAEKVPQWKNVSGNSVPITLVTYIDCSDAVNPLGISLAGLFSKRSRKTLYISLEQNPITDCYLTGTNQKGLNEWLYYIQSQKDNLALRLEACSSKDAQTGIDFIQSPQTMFQLDELEQSSFEQLIDCLKKDVNHDEVVLVMDAKAGSKLNYAIANAARVIVCLLDTPGSAVKLQRFSAWLQKTDLEKAQQSKAMVFCTQLNAYQIPEIPELKYYIYPASLQGIGGLWPPAGELLSLMEAMLG